MKKLKGGEKLNWKAVCLMVLVTFAFAAASFPVVASKLSTPAILNVPKIGKYNLDTDKVQPTGDPIDAPEPIEG